MKKFLLLLALFLGPSVPVLAQGVPQTATVVTNCGTPPTTYTPGQNKPLLQDVTGSGCTKSVVTVAGFTPNSAPATQQAVTTSSANVALPAGTAALIQNSGLTNSLYFKLGTSNAVTATANDIFLGPGSSCVVNTTGFTYVAFLSASSTTLANINGGTGLGSCPTGGGGGSGGGGGNSVAQGSATSGQNVTPMGCRTLTAAPTDTTAQTNMPSCDVNGALRVNVISATGAAQGSTTSGQTLSPIGCRTLSSAPTDTTGQTNIPRCDVNGAIAVNVVAGGGSGGTSSNFGSAQPGTGTAAGVESSGNMVAAIQADSSAAINISTATTTQLVALVSAKKIYVTGWDVIAGGTGNITLEYGTGANCGTGTTVLTGPYNLTAQTGLARGNGMGAIFVVPASNALCILTSQAVQMSGSVSFTQF